MLLIKSNPKNLTKARNKKEMLTKKLNQAYAHTKKLVDFLKGRDWDNADELTYILEKADKDIDQIVGKAISDVLVKLQGSYSEEAENWAANTMTDANRKPIIISAKERRVAQTEAKKIKTTIKYIYAVLERE